MGDPIDKNKNKNKNKKNKTVNETVKQMVEGDGEDAGKNKGQNKGQDSAPPGRLKGAVSELPRPAMKRVSHKQSQELAMPAVGDVLSGRFLLEELTNAGPMSYEFQAIDGQSLSKPEVNLRVLSARWDAKRITDERLQQETQKAQSLNDCVNIACTTTYANSEKHLFWWQKPLPGLSLEAYMHRLAQRDATFRFPEEAVATDELDGVSGDDVEAPAGAGDGLDSAAIAQLEALTEKDMEYERGKQQRAAETIVEGIAAALTHAHGKGMVHADLRLSNVALVAEDVPSAADVRVTDFGVVELAQTEETIARSDAADSSRLLEFEIERRRIALTSAYASPEILELRPAEPRDDVYSLACIAYELFTGRHPCLLYTSDAADE